VSGGLSVYAQRMADYIMTRIRPDEAAMPLDPSHGWVGAWLGRSSHVYAHGRRKKAGRSTERPGKRNQQGTSGERSTASAGKSE
jgi:hypothetical protein